jgi:hypothetical protein
LSANNIYHNPSNNQGFCLGGYHQLKALVVKMVGFENRIAEYKRVFEKWKRRKPPFTIHKDDK